MIRFKLDTPRTFANTVVECYGSPELFEQNPSREVEDACMQDGPIPCEGSGVLGLYCQDCRFGLIEVTDL